ncbi:MAG: tripartite tricarboxylate transporter substrate binding protein [Burkholderiales bacterium]|nr:tripartite tricarboxylate transporter substrate binding protein [Burkholderiales bacterium]
MRCSAALLLALLCTSLIPCGASAQPYPAKPLRLIVPDATGGSPDTLGRILAQKLADSLGWQMVVDNRPGASGILAAEIAAKAPPDGYTLFMSTTSVWAILPSLRKNLPYDAVASFMPVTRIASTSNVLVVNLSVPAKSVAELVRLAKERPGSLNYASAGIASPAHLAGEMLNLLADVKMTHVPYKGAGPALLDVIAGSVQLIITSPIAAGPHINTGRVRALASTGAQRNPGLPDLPTIAESVPGYDISQSWGITVPAGTLPSIVTLLNTEIVRALRLPDVRERIARTGAVPVGDTPEEFSAFMAAERARLGNVISRTGIVLAD